MFRFRELFVFINAATTPSLKYTVNPAYDKFNDLISFVREGDLRARGCAQGPDEVEHIFSENSLHIQTEREGYTLTRGTVKA